MAEVLLERCERRVDAARRALAAADPAARADLADEMVRLLAALRALVASSVDAADDATRQRVLSVVGRFVRAEADGADGPSAAPLQLDAAAAWLDAPPEAWWRDALPLSESDLVLAAARPAAASPPPRFLAGGPTGNPADRRSAPARTQPPPALVDGSAELRRRRPMRSLSQMQQQQQQQQLFAGGSKDRSTREVAGAADELTDSMVVAAQRENDAIAGDMINLVGVLRDRTLQMREVIERDNEQLDALDSDASRNLARLDSENRSLEAQLRKSVSNSCTMWLVLIAALAVFAWMLLLMRFV